MKGAKKHFSRALTLLLSVLIMLQTVTVPAFAAENTTENVEVATNDASTEEESTFNLINADVQIDDEYGNEADYISEVQIPDLEQISEETLVENGVSIHSDYPGDAMVYLTQRWLNQEYGDVPGFGYVTEDGRTGWDTVYGLTRALQVELGIADLADNFGPTTERLYSQNLLRRQDGVTNRKFAILQGALWCKGYNPGYNLSETEDGAVVFNGVFDADVERAIIELKEDAGLINPDGVVTVNIMKALMSMDSFKLLSSYGGTEAVREMQQKLNRKYEAYTGITPCDGVYGRNTNKALIYALQAEEGMPPDVANANFGVTTRLCCPEIPYARNSSSARRYPGTSSGSYYSAAQITSITELLQFALLVNGYNVGAIDGEYGPATKQALYDFQAKMKITPTGYADKTTWLSLFVSCGDTSRSALAADCATQLTAAKAKTLYDNGYRYIGRYLTGNSKKITRTEAQIIFDAGLKFFPIYQSSANYLEYFTPQQGADDAQKAKKAATELGLPENTIIYFAVDFDCLDYQITNNVIPYFERVHNEMADSGYRVGIYGTRNACMRVSNLGYAYSSFVGDMSTGFSGNLGFKMPSNWAFDQFVTTTIGSGNGEIEIDKDGYSGYDPAVSRLNAISSEPSPDDLFIGNAASDKIVGPTLDILGYQFPLFEFDIGLESKDLAKMNVEYDPEKETFEVLIGFNEGSFSSETTGGSTKTGKFKEYYREVKTAYSLIGENNQEFSRHFKDFKGSLYQRGTKVGFECETYLFGYMKIDAKTGLLMEGGMTVIGTMEQSISYLIGPCVYAKFAIEGSIKSGFGLKIIDTGKIALNGNMKISVKPSFSVGVDFLVANAYAGIDGLLECKLDLPVYKFSESFSAKLSASVFFEYQALFWGRSYEWKFAETDLYPTPNSANINTMSIRRDDLEFIEPLPQLSSFSNATSAADESVLSSNVQVYCNPKLVSLGNGKMLLIYIADDMDRTATNRSVLMYRVYDGASWGAAQPVLDDSTADFEPYIFSDGNGGAHVIWQNCNSVLGPNATLDEMAAAMDLYYTYWNGTSFVNTTAITANNANYEMSHRIVSSGDSISVIWQQNSENDVFALNGTNSIFRKQYVNGAWENTEVIASGLTVVTSIDTAYADGNNVVAYTAKTNSDSSDISDLEVFYYNGSETIRLTNDSIPDYSVSLLNNELYWISGDSIACISNGNVETRCTIVSELNSNVTRIKALKNSGGKKAIVWQQECDSDVNFYGVNYNDVTSAFGTVEPISTDSGIVRGWDACMLPNGQIELAYGFAEKLQEAVNGKPYGQIDLVQKTANRFYDVHVDPVVSYSGIIEPNKDISIHINVLNNGSMDINQFTVKILDTDNTTLQTYTIDHDLAVGDSGELEIPFTLPASIEKTNYTIQVYPAGQKDVFDSDNEAILTIGFADISIDNIQESRTEAGRTLTVTVKNSGYTTVNSATLKFFKVTDDRTLISTERIESLDPGAEETFRFSIGMDEFSNDVSGETKTYFFLVETEELESDRGNNSEFVYLHPDYDITLIAGSGGNVSGSGTYVKGNDAILIATPLSGYIFDGWYENGELLYGVSNEYEITVDSNRTLEARFKENDLQITDVEIFGTLAAGETISFTVSATGGVQPWQWEFYIQSDNEVVYSDNAAIVNFMEWTPSQSGTYDFLAFVTDATGKRISYRTQFVVS